MSSEAVIVFTAKSVERIIREGGTSSWRLDRNHARRSMFVVCTRNANAEWAEGQEEHQSAFLIGRIRDVVPSLEPGYEDRYLIQFSEYAQVNIPEVWQGDRNPVRYATLEELGINPLMLTWVPISATEPPPTAFRPGFPASLLTIADAKKGLALTFGVAPDAVEITIRG